MPAGNHILQFRRIPHLGRRAAQRTLLFCLVWLLFTGSDVSSWIMGVPAVLLSVGASLLLAPAAYWPVHLAGVVRFLPFFLAQSAHSGFDVMRRALSPRLPVNPGLIAYTTFLPAGLPRILFVNTISLLPGTLSADLLEDTITVHTIDKNLPVWTNIHNLEWRINDVFKARSLKEET